MNTTDTDSVEMFQATSLHNLIWLRYIKLALILNF